MMVDKTIKALETLAKGHPFEVVAEGGKLPSEEVFYLLNEYADKLCAWLRDNFDPMTKIVFSCNGAKIITERFSVPYSDEA